LLGILIDELANLCGTASGISSQRVENLAGVVVEERWIVKSVWGRVKRSLESIGVPSAELGIYFAYMSKGLFKGFTEKLKEEYATKGFDPKILDAVEGLAKHSSDTVARNKLSKIKSKIKRREGID